MFKLVMIEMELHRKSKIKIEMYFSFKKHKNIQWKSWREMVLRTDHFRVTSRAEHTQNQHSKAILFFCRISVKIDTKKTLTKNLQTKQKERKTNELWTEKRKKKYFILHANVYCFWFTFFLFILRWTAESITQQKG